MVIGKPAFEERVLPEAQTIERQHTCALMLRAMIDEGFEPWNMASVVEWWQRRNTLPGMPVLDGPEGHADTWEHNKYSVDELVTRKWIAMEIMMACLVELSGNVKALEARVEAMDRT